MPIFGSVATDLILAGMSGVRVLKPPWACQRAGEVQLLLVFRPLLVGVRCASGGADWVAGLLVAVVLVSYVWVSRRDAVDVASAQFFVNSSLPHVLLFRRRVKSVAGVLKDIRQHGFSQGRWDVLYGYWSAVCRRGPCGPLHSLEPWVHWIPLFARLLDVDF